jgi:hypothetical protein
VNLFNVGKHFNELTHDGTVRSFNISLRQHFLQSGVRETVEALQVTAGAMAGGLDLCNHSTPIVRHVQFWSSCFKCGERLTRNIQSIMPSADFIPFLSHRETCDVHILEALLSEHTCSP